MHNFTKLRQNIRLKKKSYKVCALLVAGLLLTNTCMATSVSRETVVRHCLEESESLMRLASWNKTVPCVENVELSAELMHLAARSVREDQIPNALMHLSFATQTLRTLSFKPQCAYFAIKTKQNLATLTQLSIDVERLDRYQPKSLKQQ